MIRLPKNKKGFTLVELIVGVAVFLVIIVSVYSSYISIFDVVRASEAKIVATDLVNEQFEIIRNLSYSDVGVSGSIPTGILTYSQNLKRGDYNFSVLTTVRNVDDPFDGTFGGSPNDLSPADYKLVEIEVDCSLCKNFTPIAVTTRVSPKNLETASTNGALFIKVFDAYGNPIQGALVHIENNLINPPISIDDVTNNQGLLQIVDAPPGAEAYEVTVTKAGYSTDKTYPTSIPNPNPTKPYATVLVGQVTQVSFVIDRLSTINVYSKTNTCSDVSNVGFSVLGSKLIGTSPDIIKYSYNGQTNSSGLNSLNNIEWDTYSILLNDSNYDLIGYNPIAPLLIEPNSTTDLSLIVEPKDPKTLLVIVKDSVTGLPLSDVSVRLSKTGFDESKITGQGFKVQTDWSSGSGQATSTDLTRYLLSDGNLEVNNPAGDITLKKIFGEYVLNGEITSSSFDLGVSSNLNNLYWNPTGQPVNNPSDPEPIRVQIATNNDGGTWNFIGPDGTGSSYYTSLDKNLHSSHSNSRYLRYKISLFSSSIATTPNISDIAFTFTSSCTPPGQVYFSSLPSGGYTLSLSKVGYESQDVSVDISNNWQSQTVVLIPN
ncbi:MAG: prepilin-type N-terminal cleavage/methylation domain-containing protein [Candidatus Paceibacterota bacterium]